MGRLLAKEPAGTMIAITVAPSTVDGASGSTVSWRAVPGRTAMHADSGTDYGPGPFQKNGPQQDNAPLPPPPTGHSTVRDMPSPTRTGFNDDLAGQVGRSFATQPVIVRTHHDDAESSAHPTGLMPSSFSLRAPPTQG